MDYTNTKEYRALNSRFKEVFDENIPLMMIPEVETLVGLTEKVNKCIEANKNLLHEFYEWKYDGSEIY